MSAKDISRYLLQPRKRYSGVRMQQGRVILDSDWNESGRLDDEEARKALLDIVCSKGTSNGGFLIGEVTPTTENLPERRIDGEFPVANAVSTYDFSIGDGSFYVGGLRFEAHAEDPESFLTQSDWLQLDVGPEHLPVAPTAAELQDAAGNPRERLDLVYLRGWEQCVSAVEDRELREVALGGPDTSVRIRRMRRVEVLPDVGADTCAGAFAALEAVLTAPLAGDRTDDSHSLDPTSCELRSKARLTVDFEPGETEDPCQPRVTQGFLGAENQTVRVQLTATNRFIWGYDNASPLYRVQVLEEDGQLVKIVFLTQPRDQAAQPLQGQAVEILPWGAYLPNQEKVAELGGHLATVTTSYDPDDPDGPSITIADPVPAEWLAWLTTHPEYHSDRDDVGEREYFYLRLWTGGSGDADEPDFPFAPGAPEDLGTSGLRVTFSDHGLPGDHWIVAARPNTPDEVVPWELMDQAPPVGNRFFFAPLALIRWSVSQAGPANAPDVVATVQDCRPRFRPLCETACCCSVTVGDGSTSHGDFQSIQAALDYLPAGGGEICVLPGVHRANVRIDRRRGIRIQGCGKQTLVVPTTEGRRAPIFHVTDSECITIEDMDLVHLEGTAILAQGSEVGRLRQIEVAHTRILAFANAIRVERGADVDIHHNRLRMIDRAGAGVAIFIVAEEGRIERNDIGVAPAAERPENGGPGRVPDPEDDCEDPEVFYANPTILLAFLPRIFDVLVLLLPRAPYLAEGGIQIGAGSDGLKVIDNAIHGGAGNGITLGGALAAPVEVDDVERVEFTIPRRLELVGVVRESGAAAAAVGLRFARESAVRSTLSDSSGLFVVGLEPGTYAAEVTSPGYRVESLAFNDAQEFPSLNVNLVAVQPRLDDSIFLYEIEIERNQIRSMGLSGIGVPLPDPAAPQPTSVLGLLQAILGHPVVGLEIHRNRITGCLLNPFQGNLREASRNFGFGGISLRVCEKTRISENRIEGNGRRHVDPVCGIFAAFAERLEVHHNRIVDNGIIDPEFDNEPDTGVRGGIVAIAAALGVDELLGSALSQNRTLPATSLPAARIHDNVVKQPVGQALRLLGIGPMSVQQNRFATERPGPDFVELVAGAVLVINVGIERADLFATTAFSDNQTHLGPDGSCISSQFVWSSDDVGFADNQSVALAEGLRLTDKLNFFINTVVLGDTLRAVNSRFIETERGREPLASLLTRSSVFNNTSSNQGDHCIFPFNDNPAEPPFALGNQIRHPLLCDLRNTGVTNGIYQQALFPYRTPVSASAQTDGTQTDEENGLVAAELARGLREMIGAREATVAATIDTQMAVHAGWQYEAVAQQQRGRDARALALQARAASSQASILRLGAELERFRIAVPAVDEEAAFINGRIRDEAGRGIFDLTVCLVNRGGDLIPGTDPVTTDTSGYFSFTLTDVPRDDPSAKRVAAYLAVVTSSGRSVHRSRAIRLEPGLRHTEEIRLDRAKLIRLRPETGRKPARPAPRRSARPKPVEQPRARPAPPKGEVKTRPDEPPELTAAARECLERIVAHRRFRSIGASRDKLEDRLRALGVRTKPALRRLAASEPREIRRQLRLRTLAGARSFLAILEEVLAQ